MRGTKFTQRPWALVGDVIEGGKVNLPDRRSVPTQIAKVNLNSERGTADAYLIAAALDLYEAGRKVLDGLNERIEAASEAGRPIPVFDGIAELHAALAKVETTS
jgi:hypothetical protein